MADVSRIAAILLTVFTAELGLAAGSKAEDLRDQSVSEDAQIERATERQRQDSQRLRQQSLDREIRRERQTNQRLMRQEQLRQRLDQSRAQRTRDRAGRSRAAIDRHKNRVRQNGRAQQLRIDRQRRQQRLNRLR